MSFMSFILQRVNCSFSQLLVDLTHALFLLSDFVVMVGLSPPLDCGLLEDKDAVHLTLLLQHLTYSRA